MNNTKAVRGILSFDAFLNSWKMRDKIEKNRKLTLISRFRAKNLSKPKRKERGVHADILRTKRRKDKMYSDYSGAFKHS